jgi:hypothetical protein
MRTIKPRCRECGTVVDAFGDFCAGCAIGDCIYCGTPIAHGLTLADGRVACTICLGAD